MLDALEGDGIVDVVFLDENMPGLTGLETLQRIKERRPHLPCVMITKSEEEHIMEEAIGSKMADYLIKPLNPNQILAVPQENSGRKRLVGEKAMSDYQREFRELGMRLMDRLGREDWEDIHKRLVHWDLELSASGDQGMAEVLRMQRAMRASVCQVCHQQLRPNGWRTWTVVTTERTLSWHPKSCQSLSSPARSRAKNLFVLIDNFRYDQWRALGPALADQWQVQSERMHWSFLAHRDPVCAKCHVCRHDPSRIAQVHPSVVEGRTGQRVQECP